MSQAAWNPPATTASTAAPSIASRVPPSSRTAAAISSEFMFGVADASMFETASRWSSETLATSPAICASAPSGRFA
eukprot:CAMPEP_0182513960 /NCGR_PEP_ID=MMETSP1321-20130603/34883_1 /TAXON_ID=91990 /ORGANISM="Bolidomonas sp., Strain RCC1657" /LENGTH=75 /DNA_ID=CAMNT_0024721055 /DNA_START=72 /DNA_END=295 /DNA_ORIENTATION=+